MADIETKPDAYPVQKPTLTVYTKPNLVVATPWTEQQDLYCDGVTRRVNGMDTAALVFQSGTVRQIGGTELIETAPLDIVGEFVKVTFSDSVTGDFEWVGYIVDETTRREINAPQRFTAVGLEYFLDRTQMRETVLYNGKRLGRVVPFNDASAANGFSVASRGNRTTLSTSSGLPEFSAADNDRQEWTVANILQYLLGHFYPTNNIGITNPCSWDLEILSYLNSYIVSFDPAGKTIYEILNALINPRRSLCWWLEYNEFGGATGTGEAVIKVASLNGSSVALPGSGGTLPANVADFSLNYDDDDTVATQTITTMSKGEYRAIRTRGARITSTFTVNHGDALVGDWLNSIEIQYKAGAFYTSGYAALSAENKQKRNDAFRREERFYRVYCAYRIPPLWDGRTATQLVFPASLTGGSASTSLTFHANWLRVLPRTLLAQGADYENVASIEKTSPTDTADDLLPPFGVVLVGTSPDRYQYIDKLGHANYAEGTPVEDEFSTAFALAVQQDSPGVLIRPANGMNHMMADNHFAGAEAGTVAPELDYDRLYFTISVEADHYAEAVYPEAPQSGFYSELLIEVGDSYRLDYLVPQTVVRLDNGSVVNSSGGLIRDDRARLKDIARFAYEWYQEPKRTLHVTWRQLRTWFELGYLITTVGENDPTTLNTVVGEITYDLQNLTTTIRTIGDQLNVREVI